MRWGLALALAFGALPVAGCGSGAAVDPPRSDVPVVVYRTIDSERFSRDMDRLHRAGYSTITLTEFLRFVRGESVHLPPRPILLTLDDGRADAWTEADPVLRERGFHAVLFVDAGRVDKRDRAYLDWARVDRMQRSGRWDVQLHAGTGKFLMRWGPGREDVGPFYAFRGTEEVLGGWRERVFGDLSWGEKQLAFRVRGYRPLAFSPPYGNFGQRATNDPEIPRLLLERLHLSFPLVFTQDRPAPVRAGIGTQAPIGRFDMDQVQINAAIATSSRSAAAR
jgi:peptidoglycan/xylan/chitin deacetylase (PgdA/CDA1 family)